MKKNNLLTFVNCQVQGGGRFTCCWTQVLQKCLQDRCHLTFFHSQVLCGLIVARRLQLPKTSHSPDGNVVLLSRVMINIGSETTDINSKLCLIKVPKVLIECLLTLTTYHVLGHAEMRKEGLLRVPYGLRLR